MTRWRQSRGPLIRRAASCPLSFRAPLPRARGIWPCVSSRLMFTVGGQPATDNGEMGCFDTTLSPCRGRHVRAAGGKACRPLRALALRRAPVPRASARGYMRAPPAGALVAFSLPRPPACARGQIQASSAGALAVLSPQTTGPRPWLHPGVPCGGLAASGGLHGRQVRVQWRNATAGHVPFDGAQGRPRSLRRGSGQAMSSVPR
jgi:hypothetical protein